MLIPIIYADEDILVIEKPSGVLSLPDGYDKNIPHLKSILEPEFGTLYMVHRLDKETSGVMILCRNKYSHHLLNSQFESREIHKEYRSLVFTPTPFPNSITYDFPLRINADRHHRTRVSLSQGKPAKTDFQLVEEYSSCLCLISCIPHSGYTHQIRAHLFAAGYQILGDTLYSLHDPNYERCTENLFVDRIFLHSCKIQFTHPSSHETISFTSDYPPDFQCLIQKLKNSEPIN